MQLKKEWVPYFVLGVMLLIIGILNHNTNDFFRKSFEAGVTLEKGASYSKTTVLEPGEYNVLIDYTTNTDKNYIKIYSDALTDSNNEKGHVFGQEFLRKGTAQMIIPLQIEKLCYDTTLLINCEDGEITISSMEIVSKNPYFSDALFLMLLFLGTTLVVKRFLNKDIKTLLLAATVVLASSSLLNDFLIESHDVTFHLAHIEGIYHAIINGEIPVRINSLQTNGYGYAMPTMYPNLFLYIPAILRIFGISVMLSYKVFIVMINTATVIISYQCLKKILQSENAAMIGSVIYTLSSYRLLSLYERGALGEILAMTFLPLVLWGMYEVIKGNRKNWIWLSIGCACVIMSHVISSFLLVLFLFFTVIIMLPAFFKEKERINSLFLAGMTVITMTAWSVLPMLSYMRLPFNVLNENKSLHDSSIYLFQMFSGVWGTGYRLDSAPGSTMGDMPLTLGPIMAIGILLFVLVSLKKSKINMEVYNLGKFMLLMGVVSTFAASWIFPWEALQKIHFINKIISKIQFSMRFLMPATLFLTIVAAIAIAILLQESKLLNDKAVLLIILFLFLVSGSFLEGTLEKETYANKSETAPSLDCDNLYYYQGTNTDVWKNNGEQIQARTNAEVKISEYKRNGNQITFNADIEYAEENAYFDLPLAYYPGYVAKTENENLPVSMSELGMVRVKIPENSGEIVVSFKDKPIWMLGNVISLVTWGILGGISIKRWRKIKYED